MEALRPGSQQIIRASPAVHLSAARQSTASDPNRITRISDIPCISELEQLSIDFVVDGLIAASALTLLSGDAGSGKSTLISQLAYAIANGLQFAGMDTKKRPVLVLDRENALSVVQERLRRLGIMTSKDLKIWGPWVGDGAPNLDANILLEYVDAYEPKPVIFVDSLVAFHTGSENDSTETRAYMNHARKLATMGAAVIMLHHTGKADTAKEFRGSSDIKAVIDVGFTLRNSGGSRLENVTLTSFKSRFTTRDELTLRYSGGTFFPSSGLAKPSNQSRMVDLLKNNSGIKKKQFEQKCDELGISRAEARQFLDEGVISGDVVRSGNQSKGFSHHWAEQQQDELPLSDP
jgi:archaellum biogenesis ATPase FlaH